MVSRSNPKSVRQQILAYIKKRSVVRVNELTDALGGIVPAAAALTQYRRRQRQTNRAGFANTRAPSLEKRIEVGRGYVIHNSLTCLFRDGHVARVAPGVYRIATPEEHAVKRARIKAYFREKNKKDRARRARARKARNAEKA